VYNITRIRYNNGINESRFELNFTDFNWQPTRLSRAQTFGPYTRFHPFVINYNYGRSRINNAETNANLLARWAPQTLVCRLIIYKYYNTRSHSYGDATCTFNAISAVSVYNVYVTITFYVNYFVNHIIIICI